MILLYEYVPVIFIVSYCIGAIATGFIITHYVHGSNIFQYGSGNGGATNVGRLLGFPYFFLVLGLDAAKAYMTLYCMRMIEPSIITSLVASAGLIIGNRYSIFLKAKTGKAVATSLGISIFLFSKTTLVCILVSWLIILLCTFSVGIASCAAALCLIVICSISCLLSDAWYASGAGLLIGMFILSSHSSNIKNFFMPAGCKNI